VKVLPNDRMMPKVDVGARALPEQRPVLRVATDAACCTGEGTIAL